MAHIHDYVQLRISEMSCDIHQAKPADVRITEAGWEGTCCCDAMKEQITMAYPEIVVQSCKDYIRDTVLQAGEAGQA